MRTVSLLQGYLQDLVVSFRENVIRKLCPFALTGKQQQIFLVIIFVCYFVEYQYTTSYQALNDTVNTLVATNSELQKEVNFKKTQFVKASIVYIIGCYVEAKLDQCTSIK